MKRGTGIYEVGRNRLMIQWSDRNGRHREWLPSGATLTDAKDLRKKKLGEAAEGKLAALPGRCTFATLVALLQAEHDLKRRKKPLNVKRLEAAFAGWRARDIDRAALERYVADRRRAGAADATIHNELAALRRGFRLAHRDRLVADVPAFPMPDVQNVRECWFSVAELDQLLALLPAAVRPAVEFAALTGLRKGNVFALRWEEVDFARCEIRFSGVQLKNKRPLTIPFTVDSRLHALLREQQRRRRRKRTVFESTPRVLRKAWAKAVGRRGLNKWGRQWDSRVGSFKRVRPHFHDLRHTFAQHMSDAGVPEAEILNTGGWRTRAMLDRYRVASTEAQRKALEQRDAHLEAEREAAAKAAEVVDLKVELRRQRRTA